ncbi:MAG: DUF3568 family protein [Desulfobacterales bacterium]|jgi:hypothetical protein
MGKIIVRIFRSTVLIVILICYTGCLSPLAINTVGTAGSAAPVSSNNLGGGRGESFWMAEYRDVIKAVLQAGENLSLEITEERIEQDKAFFRFRDAEGDRIDLVIERRTDTMTYVLFNVGWFGSVAFGRLMFSQIISELEEAGDFLNGYKKE